MALSMPSKEFTSSSRGAGTREERSCAGCGLAGSVFGADDGDWALQTTGKVAKPRKVAKSKDFNVSSGLTGNALVTSAGGSLSQKGLRRRRDSRLADGRLARQEFGGTAC